MSLGDERLTTTDEKGNRVFLFPAEVKGMFRKYRNTVYFVLIVFFLILPWIHWNGSQILLLDIANRSFYIMGFIFKAHDAPLMFLILAIGTISLAFVTAIFGRVWCGWACPQTVFIDGVYRKIEIWIQGDYLKRRKLSGGPWNSEKIFKYSFTWVCFFIVSFFIAHSFVAYFVGSERLIQMMQGSPEENWTAFTIVMGMTGLLLFDFGWFREQFCIIACPYGRIQSVLMDKRSMSVLYDFKRGEPRRSPQVPKEQQGDCISCRRCVEVCPTGIDIRRGIQLECIGCTACIDACDEIMLKVNKPKGLIRYASEYEVENKVQISFWKRLLRPRVLAYVSIISLAASLLFYFVAVREPISIQVLRAKDAPYTLMQDHVLNHFKVHLHNQGHAHLKIHLQDVEGFETIMPRKEIELNANTSEELHFFVKFPLETSKSNRGNFKREIEIQVYENEQLKSYKKELTFVGPF